MQWVQWLQIRNNSARGMVHAGLAMNAFLQRKTHPQTLRLGLTLASALAFAVSAPAQVSGAGTPPFAPGSEGSGSEALDAGKVAEEGDHDLDQAAREYQSVITRYDALRPRAAEALLRLGEIAARRQQTNEARDLYVRVLAEFPLEGDYAVQSRERLAAFDPQRELTVYAMDPALAQRYGLNPQNTPPGMDPTLARRYGLMVGGSPPAVGAGGGIGGGGGAGLVASSQPQSLGGSSIGGVGGMGSGSIGASAVSASPYSVNITGGSTDKAATLRAEAAQIAAQLRKLRRERRALETADFSQIPTALVEDPQALALIRSYDQARLAVLGFDAVRGGGDAKAKVGEEQADQQREMLKIQELHAQSLLRNYLDQTCLPRIRITQELLAAELHELEVEISKARPKF